MFLLWWWGCMVWSFFLPLVGGIILSKVLGQWFDYAAKKFMADMKNPYHCPLDETYLFGSGNYVLGASWAQKDQFWQLGKPFLESHVVDTCRRNASTDLYRSLQISTDLYRSLQISTDLYRSLQCIDEYIVEYCIWYILVFFKIEHCVILCLFVYWYSYHRVRSLGGEGYCGPWIENRWIKRFLGGPDLANKKQPESSGEVL